MWCVMKLNLFFHQESIAVLVSVFLSFSCIAYDQSNVQDGQKNWIIFGTPVLVDVGMRSIYQNVQLYQE